MAKNFVVTVILFVGILSSGFFLTRMGRPYSTVLLTVHKLVSLAVVGHLGWTVIKANQVTQLAALPVWLAGLTVLLFLALIATGGILSASATPPVWVRYGHHLLPYLVLLSSAGTLFILSR
jgi:hypothetical protein